MIISILDQEQLNTTWTQFYASLLKHVKDGSNITNKCRHKMDSTPNQKMPPLLTGMVFLNNWFDIQHQDIFAINIIKIEIQQLIFITSYPDGFSPL